METHKVVRITKNGKVVAEIPMGDFPVDVTGNFLNGEGEWKDRYFVWKLSYHKDQKTYEKHRDKPKGMQLEGAIDKEK